VRAIGGCGVSALSEERREQAQGRPGHGAAGAGERRGSASRGRLLAVALAVVILAAGQPARAICNLIPAAVEELRSTIGTVDRPVATPGSTVTVRANLACDASNPAFSVVPSGNRVTLVFEPPGGGPAASVQVPDAAVSVDNCSPERCDTLRFVVPDTDADLPPEDGLGRTGPARILVERSDGRLVAEIGPLFEPAKSCEQPPAEQVFRHFTVLPPANDFGALASGQETRILATLDGGGNLLIPFDFRSVLPEGSGSPIARIVQGVGRLVAFQDVPPAQQQNVVIPSPFFVRAFSPIGRPVPPILRVADDGEVIFGSIDAEQSVFRIARVDPRNPSSAPIYDLTDRFENGAGPVLITDFELTARETAPLESLRASDELVALGRNEASEGDLNADDDVADRVVQLLDAASGAGFNTGRALLELETAGLRDPALVTVGDFAAFLETEAGQSENANADFGDGDLFDTILRIFDRAGRDRTLVDGAGDPLPEGIPVGIDPAPVIDGKPIALSNGFAFFRVREGDNDARATRRVSIDTAFGDPDFGSFAPAASFDAGRIAFQSLASDLVPGDTNSAFDVFVTNGPFGLIERISVSNTGAQVQGSATDPSISGNGEVVSWQSFSAYDPGDTNGLLDVYVRLVDSATLLRASADPDLPEPNGISDQGDLDGSGRRLAFASLATNLVAQDDRNGAASDVFVSEYTLGGEPSVDLLVRASQRADGTNGTGSSFGPRISANGRYVVFTSSADDLVPGDTNGVTDVFLKDLQTGALEIVSRGNEGILADGASGGSADLVDVSRDGRFVAFTSQAGNLAGPAPNPLTAQLYVYDRQLQGVTLLSVNAEGEIANAVITGLAMSEDGRRIAFVSASSNLVPGDTNGRIDAFVVDRVSRAITRASLGESGLQSSGGSVLEAAISGDGNSVAFSTSAGDLLVPGTDQNGVADVYLRGLLEPALLNADEDADDTVGVVYDIANGEFLFDESVAVKAASVSNGRALILVPEAAESQDLNDDGDLGDDIVVFYDAATDTATVVSFVTPVAGVEVSLSESFSCLTGLESELRILGDDGFDLNDDGDTDDAVLFFGQNAFAVPTGFVAEQPKAVGAGCVFLLPEADQGAGGTDFNLDGDVDDRVLSGIGNLLSATPFAAEEFFATDEIVAFRVCEADQGNADLNQDGDTDDCVMHVFPFDFQTFEPINTGFAARVCDIPGCNPFFEPYRIQGSTVSFLVQEADQAGPLTGPGVGVGCLPSSPPGGCDLTGDGDSDDFTIVVFNIVTRSAQVFEVTVPPPGEPSVSPFPERQLGQTVLNVRLTEVQAGVDVDGDGQLSDDRTFFFLVGDSDDDGTFDYSDSGDDTCRETANPEQVDADGDGLGDDVCDPDPQSVLPGDTPCDVDRNGGIDRVDVELVFRDRGTTARESDSRDADGDGRITVLDSATCADRCTNVDCAPVAQSCGILGLEVLPVVALALARRRRRRGASSRRGGLAAAGLAALALGAGTEPAQALALQLEPAQQQIEVGQDAVIRLVVSGLEAGGTPSLRAYDLHFAFDASVVRFDGASYGPGLGDPVQVQVLQETRHVPGSARAEVAATSLLSSPNLHALQPAGFVLAELVFRGLVPGITDVTSTFQLFASSTGAEIPLDAAPADARIVVLVPEPHTSLLLGLGLLGLGIRRRSRAR